MKTYSIDGFVVVQPLSPWGEKNKDKIWTELSYSSFGQTPKEAWIRHIGRPDDPKLREPGELALMIQRWVDKGYRIKTAKLEIYDDL